VSTEGEGEGEREREREIAKNVYLLIIGVLCNRVGSTENT
jgi:hypothetical protein